MKHKAVSTSKDVVNLIITIFVVLMTPIFLAVFFVVNTGYIIKNFVMGWYYDS